MTRREAVKLLLKGVALASVPLIPKTALSSKSQSGSCSGALHVINIHTNEELNIRYLDGEGKLDSSAVKALNHIFRCHYTDKIYPIPPELYMLLDAVRTKLGAGGRAYELISGYRSPEYNRKLRRNSRGVAKGSYHLKGMAADVHLPGVSLSALRNTAMKMKKGGVGKYSDFVHLDVGPVRSW